MLRRHLTAAAAVAASAMTVGGCAQPDAGNTNQPEALATIPAVTIITAPPTSAPPTAAPPTAAPPTAAERELLTDVEAAKLLPSIAARSLRDIDLQLDAPGGVQFQVKYPNEGPTAEVADVCVVTLVAGEDRGSACFDTSAVGGLAAFGYAGDASTPPMSIVVVDSSVAVTFDRRCDDFGMATGSGLLLGACQIGKLDSASLTHRMTAAGVGYDVQIPFVVPPAGT